MSKSSSVNSEALRRVRRRKKILENSEERLRSITGKPVSEPSGARQGSRNRFLHDFQNPDVKEVSGRPGESSPPELDVEEDFLMEGFDLYDDDDDFGTIPILREPNRYCSPWVENLVRKRVHLIVLALILLTLYINKLEYLFFNNVFIPYTIVKGLEILLLDDPFSLENKEHIEFMSNMFEWPMAKYFLKGYYIVARIASDFCLYVFVIVACNKLYNVTLSYLGIEIVNPFSGNESYI